MLAELGLSHAFIDGSVPSNQRAALLAKHRVVLMTPDVAHAWLLARQNEREVRAFLASLALVVLDEAELWSTPSAPRSPFTSCPSRRWAALTGSASR